MLFKHPGSALRSGTKFRRCTNRQLNAKKADSKPKKSHAKSRRQ